VADVDIFPAYALSVSGLDAGISFEVEVFASVGVDDKVGYVQLVELVAEFFFGNGIGLVVFGWVEVDDKAVNGGGYNS